MTWSSCHQRRKKQCHRSFQKYSSVLRKELKICTWETKIIRYFTKAIMSEERWCNSKYKVILCCKHDKNPRYWCPKSKDCKNQGFFLSLFALKLQHLIGQNLFSIWSCLREQCLKEEALSHAVPTISCGFITLPFLSPSVQVSPLTDWLSHSTVKRLNLVTSLFRMTLP